MLVLAVPGAVDDFLLVELLALLVSCDRSRVGDFPGVERDGDECAGDCALGAITNYMLLVPNTKSTVMFYNSLPPLPNCQIFHLC